MCRLWPLVLLIAPVFAQPPGGPPQPPRSPKAAAPVDLTGYWVSVVSEDWRWRMVTPLKGDYAGIPVNAEARKVGEAWDPTRDETSNQQCRSYGAPALMRVPGRVHITWRDDNTLKLETDSGIQTRLFHFGDQIKGSFAPSLQGFSAANWERPPVGVERPDPTPIFTSRTATQGRSLEVHTALLTPGYLRKNGVPYSDQTQVDEFYDYHKEPNGDQWFTVTTIVRDPIFLAGPWITSTDFKKEPNGAKWDPTPCTAR